MKQRKRRKGPGAEYFVKKCELDMAKIQKYTNTRFQNQVKTAFVEFCQMTQTMLMVEIKTGIPRPNLCRYVANWKKQRVLFLVGKSQCPISKMMAGIYAANPKYPLQSQLQIFQ